MGFILVKNRHGSLFLDMFAKKCSKEHASHYHMHTELGIFRINDKLETCKKYEDSFRKLVADIKRFCNYHRNLHMSFIDHY